MPGAVVLYHAKAHIDWLLLARAATRECAKHEQLRHASVLLRVLVWI